MTQNKGAIPGSHASTEPQERLGPSGFDPAERGEGLHPQYGGCDGFGPLGMCSECTGVIHCSDGTFADNEQRGDAKLSQGEAAERVREFLLREAECAALAAAMHTDDPKRLSRFVRDVIADRLPRSFDDEMPVGDQPF